MEVFIVVVGKGKRREEMATMTSVADSLVAAAAEWEGTTEGANQKHNLHTWLLSLPKRCAAILPLCNSAA